METIGDTDYYTSQEVAALKGVHLQSVHKARKRGALICRKVGSAVLIEKASAEAWNPQHGGWDRARAKRWEKKKESGEAG